MAINKNHEFEELDGIKCGIVERNVPAERVTFIKRLLEYNHFTVIVVSSPPPKGAVVPPVKAEAGEDQQQVPVQTNTPVTFTIGVTDYTFNTINAIFGRLLQTPDGHVVTMAYWKEQDPVSHDEIPYYEQKN